MLFLLLWIFGGGMSLERETVITTREQSGHPARVSIQTCDASGSCSKAEAHVGTTRLFHTTDQAIRYTVEAECDGRLQRRVEEIAGSLSGQVHVVAIDSPGVTWGCTFISFDVVVREVE